MATRPKIEVEGDRGFYIRCEQEQVVIVCNCGRYRKAVRNAANRDEIVTIGMAIRTWDIQHARECRREAR